MFTRRQFLACSPLLVAGRTAPVRIALRGLTDERRGAMMALDEMEQTALLVGRTLDRSAHGDAPIVDLTASTIAYGGTAFHVAAAEEDRAAAVAEWRRLHPGDAPHAAVEWHGDLTRYGAAQLNGRFERRYGERMTADAWLGWIAVKIAVDAQLRSVPLAKGRFDGHKGTALYFGPGNRLVQPLCVLDRSGALLGMTSDS